MPWPRYAQNVHIALLHQGSQTEASISIAWRAYQNGQPSPEFLSSRSGPQTLGESSLKDSELLLLLPVQGPHWDNSREFAHVWGYADGGYADGGYADGAD